MAKRRIRVAGVAVMVVTGGFALLVPRRSVHAQQSQHLQIESFSVGPDQTVVYPNHPPAPYLEDLPDEHTTFLPPASGSSPYLVFGASKISGGTGGATVLQTTDLATFTFATALGHSPQVMAPPLQITACDPTFDTEFDENYAAPGSVVQDPTMPAGNMMMLYEAENHCPGGVNQQPFYATVGFARSSDDGRTWPAPVNSPLGNAARHPVLKSPEPEPSGPHAPMGNAIPSAFLDKSADGNNYLYVTYSFHSDMGAADGLVRVARAQLGSDPLTFLKWYSGSFSQPGIGGLDTGLTPTNGCATHGLQQQPQISLNDDLGLYLLTFVCQASGSAAWYYSTATSLDLQDWTTPQLIANSQFPITPNCGGGGTSGNQFDGWYPSFMSPGASAGHTKFTGMVFFQNGCDTGTRVFVSRTFTITTQPQAAPVLTSGSLANGATYAPGGLVPGSWAQVKGTGLSNVTRSWTGYDFLGLKNNLPTNLSGVQVTVNNVPAAVYYVSPGQVNFQVPTGITGTASVQVISNGTASNTLTAPSAASAPGLFPNTVNGVNYPAAVFPDGSYVGDPNISSVYRSAKPGDAIELYATGVVAEPGGVLPTAQGIPGVAVTVGTVTVPADFAAQTPYVGEFQINFTLSEQFASKAAGNYPISITVNGVSSPITINSIPPGPLVLPVTH
ncbi:MAG TPA: IPT/TIG domain-containing protein [Bryobacteraceae bacterium]|nr:IPT/TIG domain-containing protein [Bryobacteraceae bacterium]